MSECVVRMEMPAEHCIDCRYMVSRDNDDCILQSDEANERAESWEDLKAGCPFITVLPKNHGRLVDADKLKEWLIDQIHYYKRFDGPNCSIMVYAYEAICRVINYSTTIVPAERSET